MARFCMDWLFSWSDKSVDNELVKLCKGSVATSAKTLSEPHLINRDQCALLVKKLSSTHDTLAFAAQRSSVPEDRKAPALQELHEALLRAKRRIQSSSIPGCAQWRVLRAAIEQGDMRETFSSLLYDVQWHAVVLQSILVESRDAFTAALCDGTLHPMDEFALLIALKEDEKALKERLVSMKLSLADQLLVASPLKLLFFSPEDVNLLGGQHAIKSFDAAESSKVAGLEQLGHHPNIVRLFGYSRINEEGFLIMEEMDMNLAKFLALRRANDDPLGVLEAVALMLQVADGARFIHSKGMVHGDLKSSNVFVTLADDPSSRKIRSAKVSGFGTRGGSEMSPRQGDVRSFAILCAEILSDEARLEKTAKASDVQMTKASDAEEAKASDDEKSRPSLPEGCPLRLASLIRSCWAKDFRARPEFYEICQELRFIKGLLLRGDRLQLETKFVFNTIKNQGAINDGRKQLSTLASTNGIRQGPWGREEPHKTTGLFDHVADSIKWIRLKYQQTPPGVGFLEVGYFAPNGQEFVEAYGKHIIGTTWRTIKFEPDEYIKQICGSVGPHEVTVNDSRGKIDLISVVSLTIHTNKKSYGPFGEENERGKLFKSSTGRVIGFFGASGVLLDKLGVWMIPDGLDEGDPSFLIEQ